MHSQQNDYFILRDGHTHGPCSLDELRSYLTYGCIHPNDMVSPAGQSEWRPVHAFLEALAPAEDEEVPGSASSWLQRFNYVIRRALHHLLSSRAQTTNAFVRRRTVRFREWEQVPLCVRGSHVAWHLFTGFLVNPPRLWAACAQVFSTRIFRRAADDAGYLKTWPASMETVCAVLIITQTLIWTILAFVLADKAGPVLRLLFQIFHDVLQDGRGS